MPVSPRASFNSSSFIRHLRELDNVDAAPSKQSFAERLGLWLSWTDAISLADALANRRAAAQRAPARPPAAQAAIDEVERVRDELSSAITHDAPADDSADFTPHGRHHVAQQWAMGTRIGPLRVSVRAALTACSPELASLAALDAVLDKALATHERELLARVPALLDKHFARMHEALGPAACAAHLQNILLAELDIRLQPVEGLIDALCAATVLETCTPS